MSPGGICPERERLLNIANDLVTEHSRLVNVMAAVDGISSDTQKSIEDFACLTDEARVYGASANAAWLEYMAHCKEHGCD